MNVAVILCGRPAPPAAAIGPGVTIVPDLCAHPGDIAEAAGGADRLVLGMCAGEYSLGRIQAEARRHGIDALGVELIQLEDAGADPGRLAVLVAAGVARARAFTGSDPGHAKVAFPREVSRRNLVGALRPEYRSAPRIAADLCAAGAGCRACVGACPRHAYRWAGGRVEFDRAACEPCGVCVTTCPAGAITNPAMTPAQLEAQLWALLDPRTAPGEARGIAYLCARGDRAVSASGWYPVRVPCTAMVTATWLLAPLLLGAGSVALLPCAASGCPLGLDDISLATLDFAGELVRGLGVAGRLATAPGEPVPEPWTPVPVDDPFGPVGGAAVLAGLTTAAAATLPTLDHERSPVGVVAIDPSACTLCGACAAACPTGALELTIEDVAAELSFGAARCTGCGQCVPRCPELRAGAIGLHRRVDAGALATGRTSVLRGPVVRCASCGGPVASGPLLDLLRDRLGPQHRATFGAISSRCTSCRRLPASQEPAARSTSRAAIPPE